VQKVDSLSKLYQPCLLIAYLFTDRFYMGSNMATYGCGVSTEDRVYRYNYENSYLKRCRGFAKIKQGMSI
jgi:hypothetical protein